MAKRTDSHHDEKPREEASKINHCIASALDEIIRIRASSAYPVGQWRNDIGRDDEQRKEVVP